MLRGRTVSVSLRNRASRDGFGNDVESYASPVSVDDVLVQPGPCKELDASRPEGVIAALTLHFPKSWAGSLRGAKVDVGGEYAGTYRVIGDPKPYMPELCPDRWNLTVEVEAVDG